MEKVVIVDLANVKKGTQREYLNNNGSSIILVGDFSTLTNEEVHGLTKLDNVIGFYLWAKYGTPIQNNLLITPGVKARMDLDRVVEICEAFERQQKSIKYCIVGSVPESESAEKQVRDIIGDAFTSKIMGLSNRPALLIDYELNDFCYCLGKNEESYSVTKNYVQKSTQYFKPKAVVMVSELSKMNEDIATLVNAECIPELEEIQFVHGCSDNNSIRVALQAI